MQKPSLTDLFEPVIACSLLLVLGLESPRSLPVQVLQLITRLEALDLRHVAQNGIDSLKSLFKLLPLVSNITAEKLVQLTV